MQISNACKCHASLAEEFFSAFRYDHNLSHITIRVREGICFTRKLD